MVRTNKAKLANIFKPFIDTLSKLHAGITLHLPDINSDFVLQAMLL